MAAGTGRTIWRNKLHVDIKAAFLRVHALVNDVLDQPISGAFHRHLVPFDGISALWVFLAEGLGGLEGLRIEIGIDVTTGALAFGVINKIGVITHGYLSNLE